jgi:hypothetical protein
LERRETVRMKIIKFVSSVLLIAIILCIPVTIRAEILIHDMWTASGKLTLENTDWTATFSREDGALLVYSKTKKIVKIVPFYSEDEGDRIHKAQTILSCKRIEDKEKPMGINVSFSADQNQIEGNFFFDQEGAIQIEPSQNMKGILIFGEISYGVVPSPPLEDLIYDPKKYPSVSYINIPSENLFLGLLNGEDRIFYCAWPYGNQRVKLLLEGGKKEKLIEAAEIYLDGKSLYFKSISAPGIWHREELLPTYLEKDIEINWKRPFQANWKTQLLEGDIETNFPFISQKERIWRPNFGFYEYPVCFEEEKAFFRLGKKVPPSGQPLIYALEGYKDAPVEFARERLGSISTLKPGLGLRRYPEDNVGIQNCDGRAWVKWIVKVGYQTRECEFLQEVMYDFLYSVNTDKGRLEEYERFITKMKEKINLWLEKEKDNTELQPFLSQMKEKIENIDKEYWEKMDNTSAAKRLQWETEVINRLKVLIQEKGVEVYPEVCYLLDEIQLWSLIESVPGRVGGLFREMYQKAGYSCADNIAVIKYAEEIRKDIREFLITGETHETIY